MHQLANWTFIDSPADLLVDCRNRSGQALLFCIGCHILGVVSAFVFPLVACMGLLGNCLISVVFLRRMKKPSRQMIYLGVLSLADNLNLFAFGWLWMFPAKGLPYASGGHVYFFTFRVSRAVCKLHRYFYSFTSSAVCNLLLLANVERCLSIYCPFHFAQIKLRTAWLLVGATLLLSALLMLPFAIAVDQRWLLGEGKLTCWLHEDASLLQLYHVLLSNCGLLQTVGIIAANLALLLRLQQRSELREKLHAVTGHFTKEISASKTLLILSGIFVIYSVPMSIAYMLAFVLQQSDKVRFAYNISDLSWQLFFLQESTNWLIYYLRMNNFRQEVHALLPCCPWTTWSNRVDSEATVTPSGNFHQRNAIRMENVNANDDSVQ